MGNFSSDPQKKADDAAARHYVSVRMQQGVPVLDADLNLLDDLRRTEHETVGRWFVGSGVPSGNDGFHVTAKPAGTDLNDFAVAAGLCLVNGKVVRNDADVAYTTQAAFGNAAVVPPVGPLTAPAAARKFIVYLDVFEREVNAQADPALVDPRIGFETTVRVKRDWAVRVARDPEDVPALDAPPAGHAYLRLARLSRSTAANITAAMIEDLRDTQLSILRKIDVRDNTGIVLVDNARFKQMLEITNNNALAFLLYITTQFNAPNVQLTAAETLGLAAAQHVAHACQAGLSNVNALTFANRPALNYLRQLYAAEQNFMTVWRDVVLQLGSPVKKYGSYASFVTRLDQRLNQPVVGTLTGLLPALDAGNLSAAADIQEEIARLIGSAAANIARGTIQVSYANAPPGNLLLGQVARFQFLVRSSITQADTCSVTILPVAGWPRVMVDSAGTPIANNKVLVPAGGGQTTVFVDVTVQAGSSDLQIRVVSDSNPAEIDQSSGLVTLTVGQPAPPGEDKAQFGIESPFQATVVNGVVRLSKPPAPQPGFIGVRVFNNAGQTATFTLTADVLPGSAVGTWTVALNGPNTTGPLANGAGVRPGGIDVTVAADSVSCQVRYTATTTIAGSTFVTQRIIPYVAG